MHAISLRWRLLAALLLPLSALIGANAWWGYDRAVLAANDAYDRALYLVTRSLAEDLQWRQGRPQLNMNGGTGYLLENHTGSRLFYQVSDPQGQVLLGVNDLPRPPATSDRVHFFALVEFLDVQYRATPVRLARMTHVLSGEDTMQHVVQVHVAETREARDALTLTILRETLGSQLLLLCAAAALVWIGVKFAVRPLQRLGELIERRTDEELHPLSGSWPAELRPLVAAINDYMQRLGRLIDSRKRFLDNAAHQLRTPLTALKMQLGMLERQSPASTTALVRAAQLSADNAVRLATQLLTLTRAEHSPEIDSPSTVDLVALAQQVTAENLWRVHAAGADLGLEAQVPCCFMVGHAELLQEALVNLIDNALHHGGGGVHITVRVLAWGLEVVDDGPGIADAHLAHVFERFYRAAPAGVSGSGLGLAIVQEIARQHGALAQVRSPARDGRGTAVAIRWPVDSAQPAP